jgi:hypothetical protein
VTGNTRCARRQHTWLTVRIARLLRAMARARGARAPPTSTLAGAPRSMRCVTNADVTCAGVTCADVAWLDGGSATNPLTAVAPSVRCQANPRTCLMCAHGWWESLGRVIVGAVVDAPSPGTAIGPRTFGMGVAVLNRIVRMREDVRGKRHVPGGRQLGGRPRLPAPS